MSLSNQQLGLPTKEILMCPPDFYDIQYEINPWMHMKIKAQTGLAKKQWAKLYEEVKKTGVKINLMPASPKQPDLVFIDAGFLYKDVFIPSNFTYPERQGESELFESWFQSNGFEIRKLDSGFKFEGHGDNLWASKEKVFCGHGFRSQKQSFAEIRKILADKGSFEVINLELVDDRFYHLDTCFCPIGQEKALCYPGGLSKESLKILAEHIEIIEVEEAEAVKFACNSLVLESEVIIPSGCDKVNQKLENLGFTVIQVPIDEFMKAGGACKCLCMPLD
jgi:N-dimethylarginine dimethylaminohydrolase